IGGLSPAIMRDALEQAKRGRLHIMEKMLEVLPAPRPSLSEHAPRIFILEIHPDKIGEVIGPGGKIIKKITAETGATIDIEQDGRVFITSVEAEGGERARKMIDDITREVRVGETYLGKVVGIQSFGAFIEILPGREGMVHISELAHRRVARVEDVVKLGDEVMVKVIDVDPQGKIKLTRKGLLEPEGGGSASGDDHGGGGRPERGAAQGGTHRGGGGRGLPRRGCGLARCRGSARSGWQHLGDGIPPQQALQMWGDGPAGRAQQGVAGAGLVHLPLGTFLDQHDVHGELAVEHIHNSKRGGSGFCAHF
ncbi:MAG: S1 RNA-binding domain-containing protein, partial [Armatimonadota bacterium]|nr:S1 RNA-binding domain-containing protein [Armatimonadota bacterium]